MRVFISQPMNGMTDDEIKNERKKAIEKVRAEYPDEEIKIIDNLFEEGYEIANPLWYLGNSIELLSTADLAFFAEGWENAIGCLIEHECAVVYGIKYIMYYDNVTE